ncbi:MAG TPA: YIP1 family protein [Terriglobales bacterium]|nr:YIP1 family protein [Terriglobales bacterium]
MAAAPVIPPPEAAPLSEPARVINTFIAPRKTFTDLKRSASWWLPFLLGAIVNVLFIYTVDHKVGFRQVVENQLRIQPKQEARLESLPKDQQETTMQAQTKFWRGFSYAGPIVGLLFYLIIASVLFGTFKFAANADMKFKTMYALVVYAWLPQIFVALLAALSLLAGVNREGFMIQSPAATSLGALIDPTSSPVLFALLSSVDLFTFWSLALMAIGATCVSKVKRGTAFAIVFGWFAFWVLVKIGGAALNS